MKSCLKSTIFLLFFLLPLISSAQIPSSIDGIEINITPELPAPGQTVTVSVESFSTDLNAASIVWVISGKNFAKGVGTKSIDFPAPALGKTTTVLVVIMTVEGREVRKTTTLKSGGVDLIWESAGFVPPFYKGKSFFAYENQVKITAIPHLAGTTATELDPKTLVYKWTENDKVIQDQSGYGKQTLTIQENIPRPLKIQVEVGTANGTSKAIGRMTLAPGDPSISFYEENPLYGVLYNKTLTNRVRLINQEITIRAVPYTFNTSKQSPLIYNWSVNNLERGDLSTNESVTLRTKGDVVGTSNVSLRIRNENNILQGAESTVNVEFSKKQTQERSTIF